LSLVKNQYGERCRNPTAHYRKIEYTTCRVDDSLEIIGFQVPKSNVFAQRSPTSSYAPSETIERDTVALPKELRHRP
jgi:hypothetical protein